METHKKQLDPSVLPQMTPWLCIGASCDDWGDILLGSCSLPVAHSGCSHLLPTQDTNATSRSRQPPVPGTSATEEGTLCFPLSGQRGCPAAPLLQPHGDRPHTSHPLWPCWLWSSSWCRIQPCQVSMCPVTARWQGQCPPAPRHAHCWVRGWYPAPLLTHGNKILH